MFWAAAVIGLAAPWLVELDIDVFGSGESMGECDVLSVYDGDTMTVRCQGEKVKVRLYCIDAPEMGQKPWGRESRDHLRQLAGDRVSVTKITGDRYGRTVGEVFRGGRSLNLAMVEMGRAVAYRKYCDDAGMIAAEKGARDARVGIWVRSGLHQSPWVYRRR